jgi:hypothetical protein
MYYLSAWQCIKIHNSNLKLQTEYFYKFCPKFFIIFSRQSVCLSQLKNKQVWFEVPIFAHNQRFYLKDFMIWGDVAASWLCNSGPLGQSIACACIRLFVQTYNYFHFSSKFVIAYTTIKTDS